MPAAERPIRRYLAAGEAPSKTVGEGTLLSRVAALERAMEALLRAQVRRGGGQAAIILASALLRTLPFKNGLL